MPNRDAIDTRIIEEVRNGTSTYGSNGFIDSPSVVGGWPSLESGTAPTDTDHDGMPDDWETENGLNKDDPEDGKIITADGYSNLEHYLNSITGTHTTGINNNDVDAGGLHSVLTLGYRW